MKKRLGERRNTPERSKEESKRSSLVHFSPLTDPYKGRNLSCCPPGSRRIRSMQSGTEPSLGQAGPEVRA